MARHAGACRAQPGKRNSFYPGRVDAPAARSINSTLRECMTYPFNQVRVVRTTATNGDIFYVRHAANTIGNFLSRAFTQSCLCVLI